MLLLEVYLLTYVGMMTAGSMVTVTLKKCVYQAEEVYCSAGGGKSIWETIQVAYLRAYSTAVVVLHEKVQPLVLFDLAGTLVRLLDRRYVLKLSRRKLCHSIRNIFI